MLLSLGHDVYIYGAEGGNAPCTEYVVTHTLEDIRQQWGDKKGNSTEEIGYDWRTWGFRHDYDAWSIKPARKKAALNQIEEIKKRKGKDHYLLNPMGQYFERVTEELDMYLHLEPGVGYTHVVAPFCAFESAFIQAYCYGSLYPHDTAFGQYYDRVIPNYFCSEEFPLQEDKENYYLYIGRIVPAKGVSTAVSVAEYMGVTLKVAWQLEKGPQDDVLDNPIVDYVGYADSETRKNLMGKAKAVFVPTSYLEPFGGVNVEAQMCGTPVITTNFGVFPETVIEGVTGYRCDTLKDFIKAAQNLDKLATPKVIHELSQRYSMDSVKFEFQKWFDDLYEVWESSVDPNKKGWHRLP
jgi:glycosyltransferase involved in cell wall biosynthesis